MLALVGCAPPPGSPAAPSASGTPSATPRVELGRFEGDVDVARGTITFSTPATTAAGVHPDGTLTYGVASGQVYMHTVSATYDNGNASGMHPCGAGSGQIYLCAQVQAVSAYNFGLSNIESVVTPSSTGVTAIGSPYVYGSVTANGSSASAGVQWLFSLPSSSNFHFTGSATGDYWSSAPSLNTARTAHAATVLNSGVVLVAGGGTTSNFNSVTGSAELYDPSASTPAWIPTTGSLATARCRHTATTLHDGTVLIAGGTTSGGGFASYGEIYNPSTQTFTRTTSTMVTPRYYHTATLLNDGTVLIVGGSGSAGYLASSEIYDPATRTFTATGSLSTSRYAMPATLLADGSVLVAGGESASSTVPYPTTAEIYNPTSKTWSTLTHTLNDARYSHSASVLPSGVVLLAAGNSSIRYPSNSAELYEPTAQTFTLTTSTLPTAIAGQSTATLSTGQVALFGGGVAELYDPWTQTFATSAVPPVSKGNFTSTLLSTGQVLVAGGTNSVPVADCQLFF